jgi:hypothetical protein|tara:strand:+ start:333 stop:926 length:594 start_codon:yes stop_codon:yes gene_type:complete
MRIIDTLIVFRILKMLTTPWEKQSAYKLGFIDKAGKRIKSIPHPENKNQYIDNKPKTSEEKASLTPLHRLVFNLKKIINKVPFGKTAFASYAVAIALLKEEAELDEDQANELCEKFYSYLKDNDLITSSMIVEIQELTTIGTGIKYRFRRPLEQNDKIYPLKEAVEIVAEHSQIFGINIWIGFSQNERVLVTADDVY